MKKKEIIISLIIIILCVGIYFGVRFFLDKDLENQKQELQETIDKYGTVEQETISEIVHKFNTELNNFEGSGYADDTYLSISNDMYWYGLTEDISCYFKPVEFTENKDNDILEFSAIHFETDFEDEETIKEYLKYLIKANNQELTDDEIKTLIDDAKTLSKDKKSANNGKGISVDFVKTEEVSEYHVKRLYEKE